uniref:Ionotropic glutamate receptor C-terminal domain-containing protein n=1 Tax=Lutzomyia longipalpis TaxID=7200 RepID=A0A3F2ZDF1_LUTLO
MTIVPQLISKSFLYRGFEGILMTNLAKRLNFTIFHKTSDEDWGKLDGENSTGLSGMLFRGEVNFTIGGFGFSMEHQESLSNTMFYYATPLTLLIPPGRPISALEKLFLPLSFTTWMLLSVVFILAIVFIVIGKFITPQTRDFVFGQRNNYPFINLISIFYGGPMMPLPRRNFARFLVMMWILFCLVMRSSYQGALFGFMKKPRYSSPTDTLAKMYEAGFKIYGDEGLEIFLFQSQHTVKCIELFQQRSYMSTGSKLSIQISKEPSR